MKTLEANSSNPINPVLTFPSLSSLMHSKPRGHLCPLESFLGLLKFCELFFSSNRICKRKVINASRLLENCASEIGDEYSSNYLLQNNRALKTMPISKILNTLQDQKSSWSNTLLVNSWQKALFSMQCSMLIGST